MRLAGPRPALAGRGGKKQKKQSVRTPVEYPDSISSIQYGTIVDVLSEGPIVGLLHGAQSIYLDETPVQNPDGSYNFQEVSYEQATGSAEQAPIGFGEGVLSEVPVNVRIKAGAWPTRLVSTPDVDRVRVTIGFAGLLEQDPATHDITGSAIALDVQVATSTGSWITAYEIRFTAKSRNRFTQSYTVHRPSSSSEAWRVRIVRHTPDATDSSKQNDTYWDSYTEITSSRLSMPLSSAVAIRLRADEFSQIPSRAYHVRGRLLKVPSNYHPEDADSLGTGAYSGDWDGTFQIAYANNPAWVFFDLLSNSRYGLGQYVPESSVDKWSLYAIARYCDELVPSGQQDIYGNDLHERRFTFNSVIQTREQAYKVMADLASVFRGMVYWSTGLITFSQDSPKSAIHQFTPSNVRDGIFSYGSSSRTARHTVALVRWNNPENYFLPEVEYVEDEDGIKRFGVNETEVTAFGCTSRGQAIRAGRWLLVTERLEKEMVTFQTGLEAAALRPGDVVNVVDPMRGGKRRGGRIVSAGPSHVEIDEPVALEPGITYDVTVMQGSRTEYVDGTTTDATLTLGAPLAGEDLTRVFVSADLDGDGGFETKVEVRGYTADLREVRIGPLEEGGGGTAVRFRVDYLLGLVTRMVTSDPGEGALLTVAPPFDVVPDPGQVFILREPNYEPRPYRVISIVENEKHLHEVQALEYHASKYEEIESGIRIEEPPDDLVPPSDLLVSPPTNLRITPEVRTGATGIRAFLSVEWSPPAGARVRAYEVRYRLNLGNWHTLPEIFGLEASIPDARPGSYDVAVYALGISGQRSTAASASYAYDEAATVALARVTGLEIEGQGNDAMFTGRSVRLAWRWNHPDREVPYGSEVGGAGSLAIPAWFDGFVVRVYDPATNALVREEQSVPDPRYTYDLDKNLADGGPRRRLRFEVAVRDLFGRASPYSQITVENPPPPALELVRVSGGFREVWLEFRAPGDADFAGVLVWASTSESFTLSDTNLVSDTVGSPVVFSAEPGTRYYLQAAAYDAFGRDPELLNVSPLVSVDTVRVGQTDLDGLVAVRAVIDDASITTAKIRDLAVETIKIAGNAVTLFETSQITTRRTIIAGNGTGEVGQGAWAPVLTVRLATTGGPVSITGLLFAQAVEVGPNALVSFPTPVVYGQLSPLVRYRVVRTSVTPPGAPVEIFGSARQSISAPGYALAGVVSRMDSPPPGLWDFQLQLRWEPDVYDTGLVYFEGSVVESAGTYYRRVFSTGGTRWVAHSGVSTSRGPAVLFVLPEGYGSWQECGQVGSYWGQYITDTVVNIFKAGAHPPYFAGTMPYELRYSASQLVLDLEPGGFLTAAEFRR
jgi:predicted phage tail protein